MSKRSRLRKPKGWQASYTAASTDSRQRRRAANRALAFASISNQYGGEPRRLRRAMAMVLAKRKGFGTNV